MRAAKMFLVWFIALIFSQTVFSQSNRIKYNGQELFLSGSNIAWVSFARDIGTGKTDFNSFADIFLALHDHGGNAARWWLHTDGSVTPEFNDSGYVTGPGQTTIDDMKKVLDLAWEREIGVDLCLWSFNMLDGSLGNEPYNRNYKLLTDTSYTNAYIKNSLTPMVEALKGHPGVITWEIFNEPEGMSSEFGWTISKVPMSVIQRFVNLCAGAIHRIDPSAQVTNGAVTFASLTDVLSKTSTSQQFNLAAMSVQEKKDLENWFNRKYRASLSAEQIVPVLQKLAVSNHNFYSDNQLIAAGGDSLGTLDFYSVHYYAQNGDALSPFTHPENHWNLTKPVVVAEFALKTNNGISKEKLYNTLYQGGYAGAMAWSWGDNAFSLKEDILTSLQYMWDNYRSDVDVNGISGDWPLVSITSPRDSSEFPDSTAITITAEAADSDGTVVSVEFFANDTLKIGERDAEPYSVRWTDIPPGNYRLNAVATDNDGHQRKSSTVQISIGKLELARFEAENAAVHGTGVSIVRNDNTASNRSYLDIKSNDSTVTITWQLDNVPKAGDYKITFGYRLAYDSPKTQYINVNGVRDTALEFTAATITGWYEKSLDVNLVEGVNSVQLQLFWGWMQLDYLDVPSSLVTAVEEPVADLPVNYSLMQNYPNPFNPETIISYQIPKSSYVSLKVYDILGREVATLANEFQNAGSYKVNFNGLGTGDHGQLASGIYFYRLTAGDFTQIKKMILVK